MEFPVYRTMHRKKSRVSYVQNNICILNSDTDVDISTIAH